MKGSLNEQGVSRDERSALQSKLSTPPIVPHKESIRHIMLEALVNNVFRIGLVIEPDKGKG